jgi:ADP-heptose:LPS heptosyltransferase
VLSMIRNVCEQAGLSLVRTGVSLARYNGNYLPAKTRAPYVVLAALGSKASSYAKEWGLDNCIELCGLLRSNGISVFHVGDSLTPNLPGQTCYRNLGVGSLYGMMKGAVATIATENGVSHLAGHNGLPCITIYRPNAYPKFGKPCHCVYPGQVPLDKEIIMPQEVLAEVLKLKETHGTTNQIPGPAGVDASPVQG